MKTAKSSYRDKLKRPLDIMAATVGLVATLPVTLPVALALAIENQGRILHTEKRVGKDENLFDIYKFSTFYKKGAVEQDKKKSKFRLFLREHSIDEIPQLFNILKGDMSFIGPRPLRSGELEMSARTKKNCAWLPKYVDARHSVKPGLACFYEIEREKNKFPSAQWEERLALDYHYSKNVSLKNDLWIAFQAAKYSLLGRNSANLPLGTDRQINTYCEDQHKL